MEGDGKRGVVVVAFAVGGGGSVGLGGGGRWSREFPPLRTEDKVWKLNMLLLRVRSQNVFLMQFSKCSVCLH